MREQNKYEKQFIVRKYVMASSAAQAIRREKEAPVHDVWLDENWQNRPQLQPAIGFSHCRETHGVQED